jgi:phosphoribosylformylglycinamidine cyclo-ligase
VVERDRALGPARVRVGDLIIGLPSPGLRCNGYTLARQVMLERAGLPLDGPAWPGATTSLADELLRPSVIYTPAVLASIAASDVHAVAHITGGGFEGNIPRALPDGARAVLDRDTWAVPPIFGEIRRQGRVTDDEMARVFNLGLGMVMVVDSDSGDAALAALVSSGVDAAVVGRVEAGEGGVALVGTPFWSEGGGTARPA